MTGAVWVVFPKNDSELTEFSRRGTVRSEASVTTTFTTDPPGKVRIPGDTTPGLSANGGYARILRNS